MFGKLKRRVSSSHSSKGHNPEYLEVKIHSQTKQAQNDWVFL